LGKAGIVLVSGKAGIVVVSGKASVVVVSGKAGIVVVLGKAGIVVVLGKAGIIPVSGKAGIIPVSGKAGIITGEECTVDTHKGCIAVSAKKVYWILRKESCLVQWWREEDKSKMKFFKASTVMRELELKDGVKSILHYQHLENL